jgi:hypothetical protein
MDNIQAVNCGKAAYFQGLPEMMLQNIQLSNASFVTKGGITIIDAEKMKFSNVNIDQKEENVIKIYNGKEVIFDYFTDKSGGFVHISGAKSEGITFKTSSIDQTLIKSSDSAIKDAYQIISVL